MGLGVFSTMSNFLGSTINTAGGIYNNERNIKEARRTREDNQAFEAEQAQLNRDFQSKEAELAFEREVDFYEQYKSPQAQVQAYKEAGLNPALLAGGIGATTSPSASAPSGSQGHASGSAPVNNNPFSFVSDAFNFAGLAQAIEQRKADVQKTRAETKEIEERTKGYAGERELTLQKVKESISQTLNNEADTENKKADLVNIINQSNLMSAQVDEIMSRTDLNREQADYFISMSEKVRSEIDSIIQQVQFFDDNKAYFTSKNESESLRHQFLAKLSEYDEQLRKWSQPDKDATGWGKVWNVWKGFKMEIKSIMDSCFGWFGGASVSKVVK